MADTPDAPSDDPGFIAAGATRGWATWRYMGFVAGALLIVSAGR
jgi:hypothetical protein